LALVVSHQAADDIPQMPCAAYGAGTRHECAPVIRYADWVVRGLQVFFAAALLGFSAAWWWAL
jgi:hypothetical protein